MKCRRKFYHSNDQHRLVHYIKQVHTNASLLNADSWATGLFCFEKVPEFNIWDDILRLEESMEDRPSGRILPPHLWGYQEQQNALVKNILNLDLEPHQNKINA